MLYSPVHLFRAFSACREVVVFFAMQAGIEVVPRVKKKIIFSATDGFAVCG
jgi:hypothetical protein